MKSSSTRLRAIRINGAIVVENCDEVEARRLERRKRRASRWNDSNNNNNTNTHGSVDRAKRAVDVPLKRSHIVLGPEDVNSIHTHKTVRDAGNVSGSSRGVSVSTCQQERPSVSEISKLSSEEQEIRFLHSQIEEANLKLCNPTSSSQIEKETERRSPSPEPVYNGQGRRVNTKVERDRQKWLRLRNEAVARLKVLKPSYKPTFKTDSNVSEGLKRRVNVPAKLYPQINFMGLLLGPRGKNLEGLKTRTNTHIFIRGQGSLKAGMTGISRSGQLYESQNEDMHVLIKGERIEDVSTAAEEIEKLIDMQVNEPEKMNLIRDQQLKQLAAINGTLIPNTIYKSINNDRCIKCGLKDHNSWQCEKKEDLTSSVICHACGGAGHLTSDCRRRRPGQVFNEKVVKRSTKDAVSRIGPEVMDTEYLAFVEDLGGTHLFDSKCMTKIQSSQRLMLHHEKQSSSANGTAVDCQPNNLPQVVGKSIFGGRMTCLTSGFKFQADLDRNAREEEAERRSIPSQWKTELAESVYKRQMKTYYQELEKMATLERLRKQQSESKTQMLPPPTFTSNSRHEDDTLPQITGKPLKALTD